ncbi:putative plastid-lipid-associated protein 2, chloroplastic [Zea mays]|uniref:Putative plastid-lipid-associated protein 2, chloroplastic n=1 Tax=Zea mays TaxID=4577 RepID=A0A317Y7N3_MAIZE|nr:putative plastid-lipid-associated protein 2, chloroplastic [Zea mays]
MLSGAISCLGARLHLHADPSPTSPRLRVLSTRRGKRSSPTLSPADCDDEGPLRRLFVLSRDPECPPRLLVWGQLRRIYNGPAPLADLAVGADHVAAYDASGKVVLWWRGGGRFPARADGVFRSLVSGDGFSCAVQANTSAAVRCWGPQGSVVQEGLANASAAPYLAAGGARACAVLASGAALCSGSDASAGALPRDLFGYGLAVGDSHACALRRPDHTATCNIFLIKYVGFRNRLILLWYTSFSQLFPLLEFGKLPALVKVEEISQTIDSKNFTVQNCIKFSRPLATTSVSTNAKFEIRSPKRVQVHVQSDPAGRLVITGDLEQPDNPWGITPFKKVVVNLPSRINPHQTSAVVMLHGFMSVLLRK